MEVRKEERAGHYCSSGSTLQLDVGPNPPCTEVHFTGPWLQRARAASCQCHIIIDPNSNSESAQGWMVNTCQWGHASGHGSGPPPKKRWPAELNDARKDCTCEAISMAGARCQWGNMMTRTRRARVRIWIRVWVQSSPEVGGMAFRGWCQFRRWAWAWAWGGRNDTDGTRRHPWKMRIPEWTPGIDEWMVARCFNLVHPLRPRVARKVSRQTCMKIASACAQCNLQKQRHCQRGCSPSCRPPSQFARSRRANPESECRRRSAASASICAGVAQMERIFI